MNYLSRSILLLICLTVLFACDSAQMQEKQSNETHSEVLGQSKNLFLIRVNKNMDLLIERAKL